MYELREFDTNKLLATVRTLDAQAIYARHGECVVYEKGGNRLLVGCIRLSEGHPSLIEDMTEWDAGGPSPDPEWEKERAANELDHTV
jgi:hypothetical protein